MKTSCSRRSGVRQYKMQSGRMMAPRPVIISSIQKFNRRETIRGRVDDQCYVVVKSGVAQAGKEKATFCEQSSKNFANLGRADFIAVVQLNKFFALLFQKAVAFLML